MLDTKQEAAGAKELLNSEWGKWYKERLEQKIKNHIELAQGSDGHNVTVNSVMRAAGLQEALDLIVNNANLAEHL